MGARQIRGAKRMPMYTATIHPVRFIPKLLSFVKIRVLTPPYIQMMILLSNGAGVKGNAADRLFTEPSIIPVSPGDPNTYR
jgi:hypothetical protein